MVSLRQLILNLLMITPLFMHNNLLLEQTKLSIFHYHTFAKIFNTKISFHILYFTSAIVLFSSIQG